MFNNVALDVFIGLIFVYLTYSLLATILQEIVARMLHLRGKNLLKAVRVMLEDREHVNGTYISRWSAHVSSNVYHFFCPFPKDSMAKAFYSHPSVKYLGQSALDSKPAYLGAENFSATMIKLLRGRDLVEKEEEMEQIRKALFENAAVVSGSAGNIVKANIDPETLEHLRQLYIDAEGKAESFKKLLEGWFDATMERASGWYKKQTQLILFILGLAIAIIFNADSIAIYNILSKDKKAREEFVQLASSAASKYDTLNKQLQRVSVRDSMPVITKDSLGNVKDTSSWKVVEKDTVMISDTSLKQAEKMLIHDMNEANNILGLGRDWNDSCDVCKRKTVCCEKCKMEHCACQHKPCTNKLCVNSRKWLQWHPLQVGGFTTIFGWIITALAISLGAPFWFDMLNKIMQVRGSVKPKEEEKKD